MPVDKKYSLFSLLGLLLFIFGLLLIVVPGDFTQVLRLWILGFSAGWLAATWLIKYRTLWDEKIGTRKKSEKEINELNGLADSVSRVLGTPLG